MGTSHGAEEHAVAFEAFFKAFRGQRFAVSVVGGASANAVFEIEFVSELRAHFFEDADGGGSDLGSYPVALYDGNIVTAHVFTSEFAGFDRIDQSAAFYYVLYEFGEGRRLEICARRYVGYLSGIHVHLHFVALGYRVGGFGAFEYVKSDIERVAVEYPCERFRYDYRNAAALYGYRSVFFEEPQPKFFPATMMSPGFTLR